MRPRVCVCVCACSVRGGAHSPNLFKFHNSTIRLTGRKISLLHVEFICIHLIEERKRFPSDAWIETARIITSSISLSSDMIKKHLMNNCLSSHNFVFKSIKHGASTGRKTNKKPFIIRLHGYRMMMWHKPRSARAHSFRRLNCITFHVRMY